MSNRLFAHPILSIALAGTATAWLLTDSHWGPARLLCMLAFLLVGPGSAAIALWMHEVSDSATEFVLVVAVSVSLDIGVAQGMVWIREWRPATGVYCLAALTVLMATSAMVRQRRRFASVSAPDRVGQ